MNKDLSWLIAPIGKDEFVEKHWAQAPLRVSRTNPAYYEHLLPEEDLEFVLQSASRVPKGLEILVEDDRAIRPQSYSHAVAAFRNGRSLRVDSIQRFARPIMTLTRSLERAIGCPVNVNLYLTPGAGKKALSRHYDTHDVFVLQLFGRKIWRLFDPPHFAPLEHLALQRRESLREMRETRLKNSQSGRDAVTLTDESTLDPGDMLYLPRGFWHEAESEPGKVSCHLTIGIQPTTYLDLLTLAISGAADEMPLLRSSLPYGFTVEKTAAPLIDNTMSHILEELPTKLTLPQSVQQIATVFLRTHRVGLENNLLAPIGEDPAAAVEADTSLRVGWGVVFGIDSSTQPAHFVYGTKTFEIAGYYEDACRFLATVPEFKVEDLPGDLSTEAKVVLCRQLVTEGVLVHVSRTREHPDTPLEKPKWIPIRINLRQRTISWIDLGSRPFSEPFLDQTVKSYLEASPSARRRTTALNALTKVKQEVEPSGFIFHISRCGSTLLSNSLKHFPGTNVVSEPPPVGSILNLLSSATSAEQTLRAKELLSGLVRAYGQRRSETDEHLILKFSSWNSIHIEAIRELWPGTPIVILVRNPLEVAVSCIDDPPGWMKWKHGNRTVLQHAFGWSPADIEAMSTETYCARVLGEFFSTAGRAQRQDCLIIDYQDLNPALVETIGGRFGIPVTPEASEAIAANFKRYSKDPSQTQEFEDDSALKQNKASPELRAEVEHWAKQPYEQLGLS